MNMKTLWIAAIVALPLGAAAFTQEKKAVPAGAPFDEATMARMKEYGTPGPAHKVLDARVGKWTAQVKAWMAPDTEPMTSTGTSEARWILDGRYLEEEFRGEFAGQSFDGRALVGYDNMKKEYFFTWINSMSTGLAHATGKYDPAKKAIQYEMDFPCPEEGGYRHGRVVETMVDADHWTWQGYANSPDGKEYMTTEIRYTRAK